MIRDTKERTIELYHVRKQSASSDNPLKVDEPMQEEEKKEPAQVNVNVNVIVSDEAAKKEPASESQAQTRIEFAQPPKIQAQHSAEEELGAEKAKPISAVVDVEMTDEHQESSPANKDDSEAI